MSRNKISVTTESFRSNSGVEIVQTSRLGEDITHTKRIVLNTKEVEQLVALLGMRQPQATIKASDELEIGRRLDEIRVNNPRVNLSWIEGDRILIGGVVDGKELRALAELMEAVR